MADAAKLDQVFKALGDRTRRQVLKQLTSGPASVSDLAAPFQLALPSFMQHMRMLEEAGLVESRKEGRVRIYKLHRSGLRPLESWLGTQQRVWEKRLNQLDNYLLEGEK